MPRAAPKIPRDQLGAGIALCLEVAGWRLREALTVLDRGVAPVTAAVLFSFAVEEFGKAGLLHEAEAEGHPYTKVSEFYDHHAKFKAAAKHVPEENLLLHGGTFQTGVFQADAFDVGNSADFGARLSGLYVDWQDGWRQGVRVDEDLLRKNIGVLIALLARKRQEWTSP
jgi:AbiV family abortive infection protein